MPMCPKLRIYQMAIHTHFELATIGWDERNCFNHMLILFEQFIHQAHGPTCVVSDCAVHNLDL